MIAHICHTEYKLCIQQIPVGFVVAAADVVAAPPLGEICDIKLTVYNALPKAFEYIG